MVLAHAIWFRKPGTTPKGPEEINGETLSIETIKNCYDSSNGDIDLFVHGTTTTSRYTGSQATATLASIDQTSPAIEMKAGCSTSLASLYVATLGLMSAHDNAMILCTETLSKVVNPKVRETWFGLADGSAGLWLEKQTEESADFKLLAMTYGTQGHHVDMYTTKGALPPNAEDLEENNYILKGDGSKLKDISTDHYNKMYKLFADNFNMGEIKYLIPHQVNDALVLTLLSKHFEMPDVQVLKSSDEVGNIGGSSVLYTLSDNISKETFKSGDKVLMMSVGGGLSYSMHLWEKL